MYICGRAERFAAAQDIQGGELADEHAGLGAVSMLQKHTEETWRVKLAKEPPW